MSIVVVETDNSNPPIAVTDLSEAVIVALTKVGILRDAKEEENIEYDGKIIQVRVKDKSNITGRIDALKVQLELGLSIDPGSLFWRDFANVTHTWTDPAVYLEWLQLLLLAIAQRSGSLYLASWQHKAAILAIAQTPGATVNDVLNYDITVGWP